MTIGKAPYKNNGNVNDMGCIIAEYTDKSNIVRYVVFGDWYQLTKAAKMFKIFYKPVKQYSHLTIFEYMDIRRDVKENW